MFEAKIIHPALANGHDELQTALIRAFGGVTITQGAGHCNDENRKTITERVLIYTIACEMSSNSNLILRTIALQAKSDGNQTTQYLKLPNGIVEIL